uniref:Uncharacterized protein n=1 Tax=uncultured prokaryote TaxID=198431 RepID=A0A0H5Q765_9ZZZZ|nr:hypothetical protein [uncultured prokaryote]
MPLHAASKLDPTAREDATVRLYWNSRAKRWDIIVSSRNHRRSFTCSRSAHTTMEMDQAACWLVLKAVIDEMESWLI